MECYETITAIGEGIWYKKYFFNLVMRKRCYTSRFSTHERQIMDYALYFRETNDNHWEKRIFSTPDERSAFIAQSITDLQLTSQPDPQPAKTESFLEGLIGEYLSSVTFVMDYLQADFCGHHFNFYNPPIIYVGQEIFTKGMDQYCNQFTDLISKTVRRVDEYLDIGLAIEFDNNVIMSIPLKVDETYPSPEIVEYHRPDHRWDIWLVGTPPFE